MSLKSSWASSMSNFSIHEISKNEFIDSRYDLAIFTNSNDIRCDYIASTMSVLAVKQCLVIRDNAPLSKIYENFPETLVLDCPSNDFSVIYRTLLDLFNEKTLDKVLSIFVDYSSVSKEALSVICYFFMKGPESQKFSAGLRIDFGYSIGEYNEVKSLASFSEPIVLPGCEGLPLTKSKRAAVFTLGFDQFGPYSVYNYLNPEKSYNVIASPVHFSDYDTFTLTANSDFINNTSENSNCVIKLPLTGISSIFSGFVELTEPMVDYNVTFALFGPKTHTLAAILLAMRNSSITCLYCKSNDESTRIAMCSGNYVISRVNFYSPIDKKFD